MAYFLISARKGNDRDSCVGGIINSAVECFSWLGLRLSPIIRGRREDPLIGVYLQVHS